MSINEEQSPGPVLLVTSKSDLSADLLVTTLRKRSVPFVRFNMEDFPLRYRLSWTPDSQDHSLVVGHQEWPLSVFRSAWYRRMAPPTVPPHTADDGVRDFVAHEITAFLEGIWETTHWLWLNRPSAVRRAENKLLQLALAKRCRFSIPRTLVTNDAGAARRFLAEADRSIVKSIAGSAVDVDGKRAVLFTHSVTEMDIPSDSAIQLSPCIFQHRIPKVSDIRVTLIGSEIFAAEILTQEMTTEDTDWRSVAPDRLSYATHVLPRTIADTCRRYLNELGLVYGCFDFLLIPGGEYVFLELNPSGQWGWIEHETRAPITEANVQTLTLGYS